MKAIMVCWLSACIIIQEPLVQKENGIESGEDRNAILSFMRKNFRFLTDENEQ